MESNEWIVFSISVFVFANVLLVGFLFFTVRSVNKKANRYLGLFLWSIALQIVNYLLGEIVEESGYFLFIFDPLLFAFPLLIFYMYVSINKRIEKWHYLLFIPGILHNMLLQLDSVFLKREGLTLFGIILYCVELLLMIYAVRILQNHKKNIVNFYSDLEYKSLAWLKSVFILVILIHLFGFSDSIADVAPTLAFLNPLWDWTFFGLHIFMIFWIAHNGFSQTKIFKEQNSLTTENEVIVEPSNWNENQASAFEKGQKKSDENKPEIKQQELITSRLDLQQFEAIKTRILQQELYTDPELNLSSLAATLELKENELSRLINQCGNVNFYLFINQFRIEKFKELILSPKAQQLSIIGLASEAGFATKSTFYKVFKDIEGMTPKEYQNSKNKSE